MKDIKNYLIRVMCLACLLATSSLLQGQSKVSSTIPLYGEASYASLGDNQFMKNWLILGPVRLTRQGSSPTADEQKQAFDQDELTSVEVQRQKKLSFVKIGDSSYTWKLVKSDKDIVDFIQLYGQVNYAVAYALAEIKMDAPAKILIGLGSDDGTKLYLNSQKLDRERYRSR
jgi:hypothetical protein